MYKTLLESLAADDARGWLCGYITPMLKLERSGLCAGPEPQSSRPPPCGTSETSRRRKGAMVGNMLLISRQNDKKHKSDVLLKCQECFSTEGASCVDKEAAPSSPSGGFRSYSVGTTLSSFPGTSRRSFINCFAMSYNDFSNKKLPQPIGWGGLDTFLRGSWHRTILFQHQCLIATQMYNIKERNNLLER